MSPLKSLAAFALVLLPLLAWFAIVSWYMLRAPRPARAARAGGPLWAEALRWTVLLFALWAATVGLFLLARLVDPSFSLFGPIDVP
jgi:hypothetical protein